jgi:hypothetical protein
VQHNPIIILGVLSAISGDILVDILGVLGVLGDMKVVLRFGRYA